MPDGGEHFSPEPPAPETPPSAAQGEVAAPSPVSPATPGPQSLNLRGTTLLSPRHLRKLRLHEEDFANALTARFSSFLRAEVIIRVGAIEMAPYQRLTGSWLEACHIGLFKTEPLRGISLLHLPLSLGRSLVDRMMGGPGKAPEDPAEEMSEIEKALLDQLTAIVMEEWCANWASVKELKPVALGSEASGDFLQTSPPQTNMLVLSLECSMGEIQGAMLLVSPYPALEPLIRQLTGEALVAGAASPAPQAPAPAPAPVKWNVALDEVTIPISAQCPGFELTARQILHLKPGDVVPINPDFTSAVVVRLADTPKFKGRLGALGDSWAVELTHLIKP